MINIHVSLAWMPVKALLAHGRAISAGTSKDIELHGGNTFNVAAPRESRGRPALASLWVSSAPRRQTDKETPSRSIYSECQSNINFSNKMAQHSLT